MDYILEKSWDLEAWQFIITTDLITSSKCCECIEGKARQASGSKNEGHEHKDYKISPKN